MKLRDLIPFGRNRQKSFTFTDYPTRLLAPKLGDNGDVDPDELVAMARCSELVRACMSIKATAVSDPVLFVRRKQRDGTWQREETHAALRLLRMPAPDMFGAAFLRAGQKSMDAVGVFYAEIVRSEAGLPAELHPLQPHKVTAVYKTHSDGSEELTHYRFQDGAYKAEIAPDDMLTRSDWDLGGTLSPLASAMGMARLDNVQTRYVEAFFESGAIPAITLKVEGEDGELLTPEQAEQVRTIWQSRYSAQWSKFHEVAVTDRRVTPEKLGSNLDELDSETLRAIAEARVCMAFGVPPLVVYTYIGLTRATYSNLGEAWFHFWNTTMSAELKLWADWLTFSLLVEFEDEGAVLDGQVEFDWDLSNVGALQENVNERTGRALNVWQANITTLDEVRAELGLDSAESQLGSMRYIDLQQRMIIGRLTPPAPQADDDAKRAITAFAGKTAWKRSLEAERLIELALADEYAEAVAALMRQAREGKITRQQLIKRLEELAQASLLAMWLAGMLHDLEEESLSADEQLALESVIAYAVGAAPGLADDVYSGRYGGRYQSDEDDDSEERKDEMLRNRAMLWGAAALHVAQVARTYRRDDPLLRWDLDPRADHCGECPAYAGITMRASQWRLTWPQDKLPTGMGLECGLGCRCGLYEALE